MVTLPPPGWHSLTRLSTHYDAVIHQPAERSSEVSLKRDEIADQGNSRGAAVRGMAMLGLIGGPLVAASGIAVMFDVVDRGSPRRVSRRFRRPSESCRSASKGGVEAGSSGQQVRHGLLPRVDGELRVDLAAHLEAMDGKSVLETL